MVLPFTYARISITDHCQLRCLYCRPIGNHNSPTQRLLSENEIIRIATALARHGVTKIRLTGGEPLLRNDLLSILSGIHRIPGIRTIGLTTNGLLLADMVDSLKDVGVQRINISLDSLQATTVRQITGKDILPTVLRGIDAAVRWKGWQVNLNVVVMRGINDTELPAFAEWTRHLPIVVRFIELMPLQGDNLPWCNLFVSSEESRALLGEMEPLPWNTSTSSRYYRLPHGGIIGFISPMSEPFCSSCIRLRVRADGMLLPCLRHPSGIQLRSMIYQPTFDQWLGEVCRRLYRDKSSRTADKLYPVFTEAMSQIGG